MTGAAVVAGLGGRRAGGALALGRRTFAAGIWVQVAGALVLAVAGFWALSAGTSAGAGFTSALRAALRRGRAHGFFLGTLGLVAAPALAFSTAYLRPTGAAVPSAALTAAFVVVLAGVLCARDPLTFLAGWEVMTLLPAALILVAHEAGRDARRPCSRTWRSRISAGRGRGSRSCCSRRPARWGIRPRSRPARDADRGGARGARRDGDEGRLDAAARVAAARAPNRARAGLGADERRDDQGRDLRARAGARRLGRRAAGVVRRARAGAGALSAVGGVVYALFQHDLKRLLALHSIENVGIIVLGLGACLSCARAAPRPGRRSRSPRRCCTRSTTRSSRRCCSSARARSSGRSARSSSTGSAGCCGGCPGRAAPSSSGRWRSRGCRR